MRKKTRRKVALLVVEFAILLILAAALFIMIKLSKIEKADLDPDKLMINEDLSQETQDSMANYKTIALFGLDNRSTGNLSRGNSDVIMLANINNKTHEVALVSIYRDTYLDIGNGIYQKCNAAYAKGGPEQAISMLNTHLDLNITDYVTVDFNALVECIDLLGGIEMTITDEEAILLTGYMREINEITGHNSKVPKSGGTYTLDGVQASAFARIRATAGDDYKRTERQRDILTAMAKKAQSSDLKTINKIIDEVFDDIQTSFSNTDLITLAANLFNYEIGETTGFPFEKSGQKYDRVGSVVVPCDLTSNVAALHALLFDNEDYAPSETVQKRSAEIINKTGLKQGDGY